MKLFALAAMVSLTLLATPARALENIENYYELSNETLAQHAQETDPYAAYILAERYEYGLANTEKDPELSAALFKQAYEGFTLRAMAEDTPSMLFLGLMHNRAQGLPQSEDKALEYFVRAAEKGDPQAFDLIKIALKADDDKACQWLSNHSNIQDQNCQTQE